MTSFSVRLLLLIAIIFSVPPISVTHASAETESADNATVSKPLPPPYASWNVSLTPSKEQPRKLTLTFDSPLLKKRVTNTVYLPDRYNLQHQPSPVMYYLHGSVYAQLDNHNLNPITNQETLLKEISAGGGFRQTELQQFESPSNLQKASFVTVAPDTDPAHSWCHTCGFIDGKEDIVPNGEPLTAQTVPGDSFLNKELYPLIEHLLNVRNDAAGRGVFGFSQGGTGAILQGTLHPGSYKFVGAMSGLWDVIREPVVRGIYEAVGYYRDQGYGSAITNLPDWRQYNPADSFRKIKDTSTRLFLSSGDGCVSPSSRAEPDCTINGTAGASTNPIASFLEVVFKGHLEKAKKDFKEAGIPATTVSLPGVHGTNNHRVYSDYLIPEANAAFGE